MAAPFCFVFCCCYCWFWPSMKICHLLPSIITHQSYKQHFMGDLVHTCVWNSRTKWSLKLFSKVYFYSPCNLDGTDEVGCLPLVLHGAPELFCKCGSSGPRLCLCFLVAELQNMFCGLCLFECFCPSFYRNMSVLSNLPWKPFSS